MLGGYSGLRGSRCGQRTARTVSRCLAWRRQAEFGMEDGAYWAASGIREVNDMNLGRTHDLLNDGLSETFTVELVSTEEGLSTLEADWNRLSETSDHPNAFMTYGWYRAWIRRLVDENGFSRPQPYVLLVKQHEAIVGIAPMVRRISSRIARVRKLEFATIHSDYNDVVLGRIPANQNHSIITFWLTAGQWDLADLRNLRDTGDTIAQIEHTLARAGRVTDPAREAAISLFPD